MKQYRARTFPPGMGTVRGDPDPGALGYAFNLLRLTGLPCLAI
ncbi:MAG: hypothetical protein QXI87_07945 [Thermoproteota archaeon]